MFLTIASNSEMLPRMLTASELTKTFAALVGLPEEPIKHRARRLQEAGLLPNAGRGRAEEPLPPQGVASLIVAVMAAERIADAVNCAQVYGALIPRIETAPDAPLIKHRNLQKALADIFRVASSNEPGAREAAESIVEFAVDRRQPMAYIITKKRKGLWKQVYQAKRFRYNSSHLQEWITLPGPTLRALVAEAVDDAPAEWAKTA